MFLVLEVLVAVLIGLGYPLPESRQAIAPGAAGPSWLGVLALQIAGVLLSFGAARLTARRLARGSVEAAGITHGRSFLAIQVAGVGIYAAQVWLFRWPLVVLDLGLRDAILVDEMLILAPYALHLVMSWAASFTVERRFRFRRWTLGGYVLFQIRQRLLPIVPMFFLILIGDVLTVVGKRIEAVRRFELLWKYSMPVQWAVVIAAFALVMIFAPFLFKWLWGMRTMPEGPLRRRLEAFGRRVGFRTRDILFWPTRGNVLNAAIIGLVGRFRYVMITDGLIASLTEDEIEAVYAHEVGHAKHRHMLLFLLFAISFMFIFHILFLGVPGDLIPRSAAAMLGVTLVLVVLWWGVLFGWMSRRLETQADVYGAVATASAGDGPDDSAFISALENLAEESGQIRHLRGLRHPSIAERTDFLRSYLADEGVRRRYRTSIRRLIAMFAIVFLLVAGTAVSTLPQEWRKGRARIALAERDPFTALEVAATLSPGETRDMLVLDAENLLIRGGMTDSESAALAAAGRLREIADRSDDALLRMIMGACLVKAAEAAPVPAPREVIERRLDEAGPLLRREFERTDETERGLQIRAEAAMLLGRLEAHAADAFGGNTDDWRMHIWAARRWLEEAEALEPAPPDPDQLNLRGDLLAREGDVDGAIAQYQQAAGRGVGIQSTGVCAYRAITRRRRSLTDEADTEALAARAAAEAYAGDHRDALLLEAADLLREAAGRTKLSANPADDVARARDRLEAAGPLLRRLAEDEERSPAVRSEAWRQLAAWYRTSAAMPAPPGRFVASWRRMHLVLAREAAQRAVLGR